MSNRIEIWTPAEKAERNFRMKRSWGRLFGFLALGVPAALISTACGVREAWNGSSSYLDEPSLFPDSPLMQRSRAAALAQRQLEERND